MNGVPTIYIDLMQQQKIHNFPINTLEVAVIGGAASTPQLIKDMKNVLGLKSIKVQIFFFIN